MILRALVDQVDTLTFCCDDYLVFVGEDVPVSLSLNGGTCSVN